MRGGPRLSRVSVMGRGKVGRSLARAASAAGLHVRTHPRRALDARAVADAARADLVIIATRDADIPIVAQMLASSRRPPRAVVHTAGALDASALSACGERGALVGTMHPLISFPRELDRAGLRHGALVCSGPAPLLKLTRTFALRIGMQHVGRRAYDPVLYHAAAALLANGSAALAYAAALLLGDAGIDARDAGRVLGPLLGSVARNIAEMGPKEALSGPVRRGDAATVERHLRAIEVARPELASIYRSLVALQLPIAGLDKAAHGAIVQVARLSEGGVRPLDHL